MTNTTRQTGNWGEETACKYLQAKGIEIVERNWRHSRSEIDIIAKEKGTLIFVEVKVRKNSRFGFPEDFVAAQQILRVKNAAEQYQFEKSYFGFIRFDIISILGKPFAFELTHLEDAF